jgi:hypothetical protein
MRLTIADVRQAIREELAGETAVVWRGMNGVSADVLQKMIGTEPEDHGHVVVDIHVPVTKMGWWSERQGIALAYAATDSVSGPRPGYDVMLRGDVPVPSAPGAMAHALRATKGSRVHVTDVYYALPRGDRKAALKQLMAQ